MGDGSGPLMVDWVVRFGKKVSPLQGGAWFSRFSGFFWERHFCMKWSNIFFPKKQVDHHPIQLLGGGKISMALLFGIFLKMLSWNPLSYWPKITNATKAVWSGSGVKGDMAIATTCHGVKASIVSHNFADPWCGMMNLEFFFSLYNWPKLDQ